MEKTTPTDYDTMNGNEGYVGVAGVKLLPCPPKAFKKKTQNTGR